MGLKLVTQKAFEKWCRVCSDLQGAEEGGPSIAIICLQKSCPVVKQRTTVLDEDDIAFAIGAEKIERLKAKAKHK